jgi:hypothetical protein
VQSVAKAVFMIVPHMEMRVGVHLAGGMNVAVGVDEVAAS